MGNETNPRLPRWVDINCRSHEWFVAVADYRFANGQMRTGMLVCQYQLTDVNEGDGGLGLIPGSHKMNFKLPDHIATSWRTSITPPVHNPPAKAGDLIIFLEATQHGTLPWFGAGERRSLFYRYSPKYLNYVAPYYKTTQPDWVTELSDAEQAVLEPAYIYNHPLVENDGVAVDRNSRTEPKQFSYQRRK